MKLEFLPDGSPDCPLIRLYDFDTEQASQLHRLTMSLAEGAVADVSLNGVSWVEALNLDDLVMQVSETNRGIAQGNDSGTFSCLLNRSAWQTIADLISPFCKDSAVSTHQWLDETSSISLLLSPSGRW